MGLEEDLTPRGAFLEEGGNMSPITTALVSVVIVGIVAGGAALAPTPSFAEAKGQSMSNTGNAAAADVSKWTQKEWKKAKAKWTKEKDKWASCRKQAGDQKLTGRKNWTFLYNCMEG